MKRADSSKASWLLIVVITVWGIGPGPAEADFTFGKLTDLGPPINQGPHFSSLEGEWDPSISIDGLSLYFASKRGGGGTDLWVATRPSLDDPWSEPVNLGPRVNSQTGDFGPSISADGLSLYFNSGRAGSRGGQDIWMSTRASVAAPWGDAINLGPAINSGAYEWDPSPSADGLTLYFRRDSSIYQATRPSVVTPWDSAAIEEVRGVNLHGSTSDRCPHISADGLSLYFSSDRFWCDGLMDLYVATRASVQSPWAEPASLGDAINTPSPEFAPCVSSDGLSLYFVAVKGSSRCSWDLYDGPHPDLYMAKRGSLAEPFGVPIPLSSDEGSACLSSDGLTLYFSSDRAGGYGYHDLWTATRVSLDGPWQEPVNLGPAINTDDRDWSPSISSDSLELYFTSEHAGRPGDADLWVSTRATNGAPWGQAVNLGQTVNSDWPDVDPTVSSDGRTLVFTSDRPGGYGGRDLWITRRGSASEAWAEPVNLGYVVNTAKHERSPSLSANGMHLFFVAQGADCAYLVEPDEIMVSKRTADGKWSRPRNLSQELGLPTSAGSVTISPDGRTLCAASFLPEGEGDYDIWKMDTMPIVDLNGDGRVDDLEISFVKAHLGQDEPCCDIAPTPLGDGIVDAQDIAAFSAYLGQAVTDPTLIDHWAMDETAGKIAHNSVRKENDATLLGSPVWQPDGGKVAGALQLSGTGTYAVTKAGLSPSAGPMSILAWVKGGKPGQVLLSRMSGVNWLMAGTGTGALTTELTEAGVNGKPLVSGTVITDGAWHRVAFVWDGTNRSLYVDGVEVAKDTQANLPSSSGALYIGASAKRTAGTLWSGLIDDVRIYNRAVRP